MLIATAKQTFTATATTKITVKLTTTRKQLLKHAQHLEITAKGTFTPTGNHAVVATKTFRLTR